MTAAHSDIWAPPQFWTKAEVLAIYDISLDRLDELMQKGKVGYFKAKRQRKFTAEHLQQLEAALTVKPHVATPDDLTRIGVSPASAARYNRKRSKAS